MIRVRNNGGKGIRFEALEGRQMFAVAGALDTSFSLDGLTKLPPMPAGEQFAADLAVQKDGKTVVVGNRVFPSPGNDTRSRMVVARFNFDGSLDRTFGKNGDGQVAIDIGERLDSVASAVVIQPDGKIVIGGYAQLGDQPGDDNYAVARLLPSGLLDTTFDGDGKRTIAVDGRATDVALQSDGKIVIVGDNQDDSFNDVDHNFGVARLNPNGSLDESFDGDGRRQIGFGGSDGAEAVAIDETGRKIIIVGSVFTSPPDGSESFRKFAITRLNMSNGARDATFGPAGDGTLVTSFAGRRQSEAKGVLVQPDGKIIVVGSAGQFSISPNNFDFAVARYLPSGRLDTTFGAARTGMVEIGFGSGDHASDIIRANDGNFIIAGTSNGRFALAAMTNNGALDRTFGTSGLKITGADASSVAIAQGAEMNRFAVAGGKGMQTARFLDRGANLLDLALADREASEQGRNKASLVISRSERLPIPTRVEVKIGGTALGPTSGVLSQLYYDLSGVLSLSSGSRGTPGTALTGSVIVEIPANQTSATITLTPRDDMRAEERETATFALVPPAGFAFGGNAAGTVTISDNDQILSSGPGGRTLSASKLKLTGLFSDREIELLM
jgi:uncharacterized delta-60 repeat protein